MKKIEVGVLGATGMVGQHFVKFLQNHPWFDLTWVGASDRSAGKKYSDATAWRLEGVMPEKTAGLTVQECVPGNVPRLVFSATDASVATEIERAFAQAGHVVVSNSRNHRMENDVPLLVPEVNADHLKLIPLQQAARGWKGQIVTNPNCSTVVLTMALAPLKQFGIRRVVVTTMQAISGAGYPGVPSMDITANVIPFIGGEEEKMEQETQKILGEFRGLPQQVMNTELDQFGKLERAGRTLHRWNTCGGWSSSANATMPCSSSTKCKQVLGARASSGASSITVRRRT